MALTATPEAGGFTPILQLREWRLREVNVDQEALEQGVKPASVFLDILLLGKIMWSGDKVGLPERYRGLFT